MLKKIIFLLLLFTTNIFWCQKNNDTSKNTMFSDFLYDMGSVFNGVGYSYSRPFHWKGDDFLNLALVTSSTLGIYTLDTNINRSFQDHKDDVPNILLDYGWYAGSPQNNYGFTGAVYLTGLFTKNEKLRRTGVLLISSATATGLFQQILKSATGRARPEADLGKNHFKPFGGDAKYRSFPSGHAVLTFTNAHVIAKQFKSWWVKAPIYAIGVIPGLSRIYEEAHWASDVFLSWAISYFMVEAIDRYLDRRYKNKYNSNTLEGRTAKNRGHFNLFFLGNSLGVSYNF